MGHQCGLSHTCTPAHYLSTRSLVQIPEKTIKTSFDGSVEDWADSLASRIQGGDYASQASQWISCSDPRDRDVLEGQRQFVMLGAPFQGYLKCPQVWAIESSASPASPRQAVAAEKAPIQTSSAVLTCFKAIVS